MAKKTVVTIKGVGQAQASALKFLNDVKKDKRILQEIGDLLVFQIQKQTTSGLGEYKQKPLTENTIVSRDLLAEANSLAQFAKPKRSNLTLSGQLLSSIKSRADAAGSAIIIFLKPFRYKLLPPSKDNINTLAAKKPKSKRGHYHAIGALILKSPPKETDNNKIKEDLESQGRNFLFMSTKLQLKLEKNITSQIRKQLDLYNKIKRKLSL